MGSGTGVSFELWPLSSHKTAEVVSDFTASLGADDFLRLILDHGEDIPQ